MAEITKEIRKIIDLDKRALRSWIVDRLSGRPTSLPPQISKGEDPEDLIVALFRMGDVRFSEHVVEVVIDVVKEQVSSHISKLNLGLLSGLVFLADALEIRTAGSLLIPFLFRKKLGGKINRHGDLHELIF